MSDNGHPEAPEAPGMCRILVTAEIVVGRCLDHGDPVKTIQLADDLPDGDWEATRDAVTELYDIVTRARP